MIYAFNPKTLRIRSAETKSKLGKASSTKIFDSERSLCEYISNYLSDLEKESEKHTRSLKEIHERIKKIQAQLSSVRGLT